MARQNGRKWMGDVLVEGKRKRVLFNTKEEAELFEASNAPVTVDPTHLIGWVFEHGCARFWKGTKNEKDAVRHTKFLINHFGPDEHVSTITAVAIQELTDELKEDDLAPATINRKMAALSKLLKHALTRKVVLEIPKVEYLPENNERNRFLTREEEQAIMDALPDHHRAFAVFLLYTGCRFSEATRLQWGDVRPEQVTFFKTKNGKARTIPLAGRAKASLQYTQGNGWVRPFAHIHYDAFNAAWHKAKERAGLKDDPDVVPHVLRHTCASRMVQGRGKDSVELYRVSKWLGHSSVKVTERYAHLRPSDLNDALAFLEG